VEILPRDALAPGPKAPIDEFTWDFARDVRSNALLTKNTKTGGKAQTEKFLFYRGLGNFAYPRMLTNDGRVVNVDAKGNKDRIFDEFIIRTDGVVGAYNTKSCKSEALEIPAAAAMNKDYVEPLSRDLVQAMENYGLYHDEALAMVNTWRRQWLRTPGIRVLYITSQAWTDALIPLSIEPAPDRTVRMMMIRNEILTPEVEQADLTALKTLARAQKQAYFTSLGRFAEPRLRRACALAACASADAEVVEILGQKRTSGNSAQQ
jgi:hypothetical protein